MKKVFLLFICVLTLSGCTKTTPLKETDVIPAISIPTPTPLVILDTTNWKTYKSKSWSFKYPSDWEAVDCGDDDFVILGPKHLQGTQINCATSYPHPKELIRMEKHSKKSQPVIPYTDSDILKTRHEEIKVGNETGFIQTLLYPDGSETYDGIYVEHTDSFIWIHIIDRPDTREIGNTILSTFIYY
jgi:hypothetical protein